MPYAERPTIVLGADGFLGRNLVAHWRARGWPVHPVGRAAGDFTDAAVVDLAFRDAPKAGRILHAITKQRTGAIQYEIQGELLRDNARIHLNVLDAWRAHQPQAKLISLGSSCVYPESPQPLPEDAFRSGAPHPSVRGYATAKEILAIGCETFGAQYGLQWLHCILATVYGPHAHTEAHRSHFMAALIARAAAGKARGDADVRGLGQPGDGARPALCHRPDRGRDRRGSGVREPHPQRQFEPAGDDRAMRPGDPRCAGLAGPHRPSGGQFPGRRLQEPGQQPLSHRHRLAPEIRHRGRCASRAGRRSRAGARGMIIVSRTPLRVSFFGGGTDYPEYFRRARGAVIGMAIDKYIYISALRLSSILDYRYRVSYSRVETVTDAAEIQHPVVRSVIQHYSVDRGAGPVDHGGPAGQERPWQQQQLHRRLP